MSKRLCFVLPDVKTARRVEKDLLLARVETRRMHFLARRDVNLGGLPEATLRLKTDLVHGILIGLFTGAVAGGSIGVVIYLFPGLIGRPVNMGVILICALLGGLFGAWVSSMIGVSTPNIRLKPFAETIDAGNILLFLDLPPERVDEVRRIIKSHHPEAEDHGLDPTVPLFP